MQCPRCGCEDISVFKTYRMRRFVGGKFVFSNDVDTRKVICSECSKVYYTETKITHELDYDDESLKQQIRMYGDE